MVHRSKDVVVGNSVWDTGSGDGKRGSFGKVGPAPSWGYPGLGALMEFLCWSASLGGRGKAPEEVVLTPQIFWSLLSTGHQTDLRHLHQPCNLAGLRSQAEETQPLRMVHRARVIPEGPADACLPRGHPRTWLGAEDSRNPGHHCWASRGGQPEEAEWLGQLQVEPHRPSFWTNVVPRPKAQGLALESPVLAFSPSASVCLVGDPSWSPPCLCVSLPSLLCMSVWAFCFGIFLSIPTLPLHLPRPLPPLPELPQPHHIIFSSAPLHIISFQPLRPSFASSTNSFTSQKREKKRRGDQPPPRAQTKTNLECVSKCCVLLVACVSLWPAACSPALPVCRVSCPPARLALPANDTEFSAWVSGDGL